MGLHKTPYGTFYVQHSLRTGEVMQVLPVKRPETPSHLPSVDDLGITENFIERRRATLAASEARVSQAQDLLQQELAVAGGERLLETGKAVLAGQNVNGNVYMAEGVEMQSGEGSSGNSSSRRSSHHHHHQHQHHQPSQRLDMYMSQPMETIPQVLPVRPWSDSLNEREMVNLPPFRQIDSAKVLSQDSHTNTTTAATGNGNKNTHTHSMSSTKASTLISQSSFASATSANSVNRAIFSPVPSDSCGMASNTSSGAAYSAQCVSSTLHPQRLPRTSAGEGHEYSTGPSPGPSASASCTASSSSSRKNKTMWIIHTLEPRKKGSKQRATGNGCVGYDYYDDDNDDEPQQVNCYVETHVQGNNDNDAY